MEQESLELKEHISQLSDEELVEMVTSKSSEYRDEAIYFAKKELEARRVDVPEPSDDEMDVGETKSTPILSESSAVSSELSICSMCGGKLRRGTLVAEKELSIIFSDNQEERFVKVTACSQCGNISMTVDYEVDVEK